jgi:hypothetical protein
MQSYYTSLEDNFANEDEVLLEPSDYGANEAEGTSSLRTTYRSRDLQPFVPRLYSRKPGPNDI